MNVRNDEGKVMKDIAQKAGKAVTYVPACCVLDLGNVPESPADVATTGGKVPRPCVTVQSLH